MAASYGLAYSRDPRAATHRRRLQLLAWGVLAAALLLSVVTLPVRRTVSRMDAVTGSMDVCSFWFGVSAGRTQKFSAIELRLKQAGAAYTPDWRLLHDTDRNLFGRATRFGCGEAPPIYPLHTMTADFAAASTDEELREFIRVMQAGTPDQQRAAVDAACERALIR